MVYSEDHMEAACCLWEAMLEMRPKMPDLDRAFVRNGASAMRLRAVFLADECCQQWDLLSPDAKDVTAFDWDFVPEFIAAITWEG